MDMLVNGQKRAVDVDPTTPLLWVLRDVLQLTGSYKLGDTLTISGLAHLAGREVAMLANVGSNYLNSGKPPRRWGNAHANIVPYQTFATSDGFIIVAFPKLANLGAVIGEPSFLEMDDEVADAERREFGQEGVGALLALLAPDQPVPENVGFGQDFQRVAGEPRFEREDDHSRLALLRQPQRLACGREGGNGYRHAEYALAKTRHRAALVADAAGQPATVDLKVQRDAVVVDGAVVGVLQAQLDHEAHLQPFALQRLDAGDLNIERVAR